MSDFVGWVTNKLGGSFMVTVAIVCGAFLLGLAGMELLKSDPAEEKIVEEVAEVVIKNETGVDIDLSKIVK